MSNIKAKILQKTSAPALFRTILAALLISLASGPILASGLFTPATSTITLPAQISVRNNAPIGSILWQSGQITSSLSTSWELLEIPKDISSHEIDSFLTGGTLAAGQTNIYTTNTPGVGIRWWIIYTARNFASSATTPITTSAATKSKATGWLINDVYTQRLWLELVKTGEISGGPITSGTRVTTNFSCNPAARCRSWTASVTGSTRVIAGPSCSIAATSINVPMGRVPVYNFKGVGSTSLPQSFDITLNCSGGTVGTQLRPYVTLTDATTPANRSSTLSLAEGTGAGNPKAGGIAMQILKGATVLSYGEDSPFWGNPNQWEAGTITAGMSQLKIALTARYVQTGDAITTGQANARATFTLSYQ